MPAEIRVQRNLLPAFGESGQTLTESGETQKSALLVFERQKARLETVGWGAGVGRMA